MQPPGPLVTERDVLFRLPDPEGAARMVRLCQELTRPRIGPDLRRAGDAWELRWPRRGVDRMEYQFQVAGAAGDAAFRLDPGNPLRAPGAFGEKSVIQFPGYRSPAWLDAPAPDGTVTLLTLDCPSLGVPLDLRVWSPPGAGAGQPLPLLVVHDGTDYDHFADLLRLLAHAVRSQTLPPLRAALLVPALRNEHYSASPAYAAALAGTVLPALEDAAPSPPGPAMRIGMGASLGALAMLHAQRTAAAPFGALLLQSGSFFQRSLDPQESKLIHFDRIDAFVAELLSSRDGARPVPVVLTCGAAEENLANNRAVAAALAGQGHPVRLHTSRDAHNWVSWRDLLDPHLLDLLRASFT